MPNEAFCHGNGEDHCCYLAGQVCPFLRDDGPQPNGAGVRRWVCTLREELGDWDLVHADQRYIDTVGPLWNASGWQMQWAWEEGVRCGNWPGLPRLDFRIGGPYIGRLHNHISN